MKISKEEILNVAKLARLELDDSLADKLSIQVGSILEYIETLNTIDTTGVPPTTHAISLTNAFREDVEKVQPGTEKAIANAPDSEDGCFVVPKIVGS